MTDTTSTPRQVTATVAALPSSAAARFGDRIAARFKLDGAWHEHHPPRTPAASSTALDGWP